MSYALLAQENILVYAGPGAEQKCVANTLATIKYVVGDKYNVIKVGPDTLLREEWLKDTALLVMPGGADRPYLAKLRGKGNANIKQYVANGGKFLGICAGAYYSADRIVFALGDKELEVTGERELKFFPGLVAGPTYSGFDHRDLTNYAGTRAAKLSWQVDHGFTKGKELRVFYNGGGSFIAAESYPNITVLARYTPEAEDATDHPAAIIEGIVGKGKVILSGPHFEWDPESLDINSSQLAKIKPQLTASNDDRIALASYLLTRLGL